ncbi:GDSL-type esterase/lipase family protein [Parapedobacter sp. DT-150]|uniref:GDSL-type esterase/lipase family protein n=1 Tax=Parapedobacter sp. DT-150 TaxID=3396162 RepID=UPI003F19732E
MRLLRFITISILFCGCTSMLFSQQADYPFEKEIVAYRDQDRLAMPAPGGILFIGSSSIRMWNDLESRFADAPIIRRGVGGCRLAHFVEFYMDSIVYPYQAQKVFVYAGENDIASGESSAEEVAELFKQLYHQLNANNPDVQIFFMSIKPSNSRLKWLDEMTKANQLIEAFLGDKEHAEYIDMGTVLLDREGKPDDSLFREDKLHLNTAGYDRWEAIIRPYVER